MVQEKTLAQLKRWFEQYSDGFHNGVPEHDQNIDLKIEHTRRVCAEIRDIGNSLHLDTGDLRLAEVVALFHDLGRFEQYDRYGTFVDLRSEDHAVLGVKVLNSTGVLEGIHRNTQGLIKRVVGYHNWRMLPEDETEDCLFFTKLLRDADKLDIFRVVTDYYRTNDGTRNTSIELDLPDTPDVSEEVCADIKGGKIVKTVSLRTLNDFKLLQMAWVYDVNFSRTFRLIKDRKYLEAIRRSLPKTKMIADISSQLEAYVEKQCGQDRNGERIRKRHKAQGARSKEDDSS
ncbi:MAG: HD domain-containing protein [Thermodesulfobacteriota bacterium]